MITLTPEQMRDAANSAGLEILSCVRKLKIEKDPLDVWMNCEFWLLDNDFDVQIQVRLKSKRSQLAHGLAMFRTNK